MSSTEPEIDGPEIIESEIVESQARELNPFQLFGSDHDIGNFAPNVVRVQPGETVTLSGTELDEDDHSFDDSASNDPRDPRTHENAGEAVAAEDEPPAAEPQGDQKVPFSST